MLFRSVSGGVLIERQGRKMKVQCCVCNKIREDGQWVAAAPVTQDDAVSHGYCPTCLEQAHREIRSLRFGLPTPPRMACNQ